MATDSVWAVLAVECMVKVNVVKVVTCVVGSCLVASGRLSGKWFVESYVGSRCKLFVGEWLDVSYGSV